jgi:hypothetical protein
MGAHPLHQQLEVPAHHVGLGGVAEDQQQQDQVAEQQHGQESLAAAAAEVEHVEERVEQRGHHGQRGQPDGQRTRDDQVEPGDATPAVPEHRGGEQRGGEQAAEDPKGDHARARPGAARGPATGSGGGSGRGSRGP